ncbi:YebC/PmpR family DNA-binding transcriptional regulator [Patescibacteria group bacterium]|nr:YebC/PmpR family DNA-binding transcriptional regulator [Patescibacteria group bacterium]
MSGHSKWSTIKRKKGAQDVKRSAAFSKLARFIQVAARGGDDPGMNFRLKLAIQKAREANMPNINIEKAIAKGSGTGKDAVIIEEITYEGLAPGNVGVVIEVLTDNKNRTVAEIRSIFNKSGATFGTPAAWQFEAKGVLQLDKSNDSEADELAIIEAGALDLEDLGETFVIYTAPKELDMVKSKLGSNGRNVKSADVELVAKNKTVVIDVTSAKKILNFLDAIEEHDDVVNVYSALEVPDNVLSQIS